MLNLTPEEVIQRYQATRWVKTAPTRIRPITEEDIRVMGPSFRDLEGCEQRVALDRSLCIGPEGEMWTCSNTSLERDRFPVGSPDNEGFTLYHMRNPRPVYCFDIPEQFTLQANGKTWESQETGGIITWNGKCGQEAVMRVIKRNIFHETYTQI